MARSPPAATLDPASLAPLAQAAAQGAAAGGASPKGIAAAVAAALRTGAGLVRGDQHQDVVDEVMGRIAMVVPSLAELVAAGACADPAPRVSGGKRALRNAGLHVDLGCGAENLPKTAREAKQRGRGGRRRSLAKQGVEEQNWSGSDSTGVTEPWKSEGANYWTLASSPPALDAAQENTWSGKSVRHLRADQCKSTDEAQEAGAAKFDGVVKADASVETADDSSEKVDSAEASVTLGVQVGMANQGDPDKARGLFDEAALKVGQRVRVRDFSEDRWKYGEIFTVQPELKVRVAGVPVAAFEWNIVEVEAGCDEFMIVGRGPGPSDSR